MIDENKLPVYKPVLRVLLGCAIMAQTRNKAERPKVRTTFIVDEAAAIGHIPELRPVSAISPPMPRMLLVIQDFGQIETNFPKARSIIANAGAVCIFGVRESGNCRAGLEDAGAKDHGGPLPGNIAGQYCRYPSAAPEQRGRDRPLPARPSEILRMGDREALVFVDGVRFPARVRKIRYWKEWRFRGHWDRWRAGGPSSLFPAAGTGSAGSPVIPRLRRISRDLTSERSLRLSVPWR